MPELYNASEYLPEFISAVAETGVDFKDAIQAILDFHPETISWANMESPTFDLGKYHKTGNLMVYAGVNHPKVYEAYSNASSVGGAKSIKLPYGVMIRESKNADNSYTMTYTITQGKELLIIKNTTSVTDPTSGKPVYTDMNFSTDDVLHKSSYTYKAIFGIKNDDVGYIYLDNFLLDHESPILTQDGIGNILVLYRIGDMFPADGWYLRTNYGNKWTIIRYKNQMDLSVYDPRNQKKDMFKYVDDGMKEFDAELADWFKHKANELKLRHTTAEMQADYNARISPTQLTDLQNKKLESAKKDADSSFEDSLHLDASEESLATLNTDYNSHLAGHIDADDIARWDSKAEADHMHKASDGKNTWIAVGYNGIILRSTDDGLTWTNITSGVTGYLMGIHYSNNTCIIVGGTGTILRSTDNGLTWTKITVSGVSGNLNSIHYANNTWIAVGAGGTILRSTDNGLTWAQITVSGVSSNLKRVYCSNNTWIIVGYTSTIIRSTDDGLTWTRVGYAGNIMLYNIYYANNVWIIVGYASVIYRSTDDGLTWPKITISGVGNLYDIHYANNTWIIVANSGVTLRSTDNGLTWTQINVSGVSSNLNNIYYSNNIWLAIGDNGVIIRSTDNGLTWTNISVSGVSSIHLYSIHVTIDPAVQIDASNIISGVIDHERFSKKVKNQSKITETSDLATLLGPNADISQLFENQKIKLLSTPDPQYYYITDLSKMGTANYMQGLQDYTNKIDPNAEIDWSIVTDIPSTLQDFGIKDAYKKTEVDTLVKNLKTDIDTEKNKTTAMQSQLVPILDTTYPYEYPFNTRSGYGYFDVLKNPDDASPTNPLVIPAIYPGSSGAQRSARDASSKYINRPEGDVWIAVGAPIEDQYNPRKTVTQLLRSTDNGSTWSFIENLPLLFFQDLCYGDGTWIGVGLGIDEYAECAMAMRSTNDGLGWTQVIVTKELDLPISIYYNNGVWIIGGVYGYIYRSIDDGVTWTKIQLIPGESTSEGYIYANCAHDQTWIVGYATSAGIDTVVRSTDNGLTWTRIDIHNDNIGSIMAIGYGNNTWIAVGNGYAYRSLDDGVTWSKTLLPWMDPSLNTICYADGVWIAGGDIGSDLIIRSTDNGVTWTKISINMNVSEVRTTMSVYRIKFANDKVIAVGTGGFLESSDKGLTWKISSDGELHGIDHAYRPVLDIPQTYTPYEQYNGDESDIPEVDPSRERVGIHVRYDIYGLNDDGIIHNMSRYTCTFIGISSISSTQIQLYTALPDSNDTYTEQTLEWIPIPNSIVTITNAQADPITFGDILYLPDTDIIVYSIAINDSTGGTLKIAKLGNVKDGTTFKYIGTGVNNTFTPGFIDSCNSHVMWAYYDKSGSTKVYIENTYNYDSNSHIQITPQYTINDEVISITHSDTVWALLCKGGIYTIPINANSAVNTFTKVPIILSGGFSIDTANVYTIGYKDKRWMMMGYDPSNGVIYIYSNIDISAPWRVIPVPNFALKPSEIDKMDGKLQFIENSWVLFLEIYINEAFVDQYGRSYLCAYFRVALASDYVLTPCIEVEGFNNKKLTLLYGAFTRILEPSLGYATQYSSRRIPNRDPNLKIQNATIKNEVDLTPIIIITGSNGLIFRSTDNGLTWTKITSGVNAVLYDNYYSNNIWIAVGGSNIFRSTDDGLTWTKISVSGVSGYLYGIHYANNTWIIVGQTGTILRSTDNGLTWTKVTVSGVTSNLWGISYSNNNNVWITVGLSGTILRSTDNGLTWTKITVSGVSGYLYGIHYANNVWIVVGGTSTILRSTDNGLTWIQHPTSNNLANIHYANNIWIAVGYDIILRSTDNGLTWTKITVSSGHLDSINYINHTWITVGMSSSVLRSTDNGLTWTNLGIPPIEEFLAVSASPTYPVRFNPYTEKFIIDLPIANYIKSVDDYVKDVTPTVSQAQAVLDKTDKSTFK